MGVLGLRAARVGPLAAGQTYLAGGSHNLNQTRSLVFFLSHELFYWTYNINGIMKIDIAASWTVVVTVLRTHVGRPSLGNFTEEDCWSNFS